MAENRTLLSQAEIDALVNFLQDKKEVSMDSVLDQSSIDRIIDLIKFNNNHGIFFNNETPDLSKVNEVPVYNPATGAQITKADYQLAFEKEASGFVQIYCCDSATGTRFAVGPTSLVKKSFVADDTTPWGRAIAPRTFCKVANLFRIDYTNTTFSAVCENFAEVMYGDPKAKIADIYLPPEM